MLRKIPTVSTTRLADAVTIPALRIRRDVHAMAHAVAREQAPNEFFALMAGERGQVTSLLPLASAATRGSARVTPETMLAGIKLLRDEGLVLLGACHGHGNLDTFHSCTDDENLLQRLLPGMASQALVRPPHAFPQPVVTGADSAHLPLADGRHLEFRLIGPELPDSPGCRLRPAWSTTRFAVVPVREPNAQVGPGELTLQSDGVELVLQFTLDCQLHSRVVDRAPVRRAELFSLVVNSRGDEYVEGLVLLELATGSVAYHGPTHVEQFDESADRPSEQNACRPQSVSQASESTGNGHGPTTEVRNG